MSAVLFLPPEWNFTALGSTRVGVVSVGACRFAWHGTHGLVAFSEHMTRPSLMRRVLTDMRSSDWSFWGVTYAGILGSMLTAGGAAMWFLGPSPEDAAQMRAQHKRRDIR